VVTKFLLPEVILFLDLTGDVLCVWALLESLYFIKARILSEALLLAASSFTFDLNSF